MEVIDKNTNNLYVIKRRLADLKMLKSGHYEYAVGDFLIQIYTHRVQEQPKNINIVSCNVVDVILNERKSQGSYYEHIRISDDLRFKDYKPIQYEGYNHYDLNKMPLINLCELIKYLHKLAKLSVFV